MDWHNSSLFGMLTSKGLKYSPLLNIPCVSIHWIVKTCHCFLTQHSVNWYNPSLFFKPIVNEMTNINASAQPAIVLYTKMQRINIARHRFVGANPMDRHSPWLFCMQYLMKITSCLNTRSLPLGASNVLMLKLIMSIWLLVGVSVVI